MWRCTRCETDNADADILCNGCDWHSPNLVTFESTLIEEKEIPTYIIKWDFTHTTNATINNGIGVVSASGETEFSIREKTILVFSGENEHARKEFSRILLLPAPIIEYFKASEIEIRLGKPIALSWLTKYADKVLLSNFGDVTGSTNKDVLLRKTSSIILTAENPSGKQEKVIAFTLPVPVINDFNSDCRKVIAGDEIVLSWRISNAEKLLIVGLEKEEIISGESKKIVLYKTTILQLKAINESGTTKKLLSVDVVPKPEISFLKLNQSIALKNNEIEVSWEAKNFSKLFLLIDADVLEVSDKTSYKFEADKSKELKLVCESLEKLKTISQTISLTVIEKVSVNFINASSLYTIQSKPIYLSWSVSNATVINLLPFNRKLETNGTLSVLPSTKTVYVIEAKNELTTDRKEIEIDVLPLPTISNIHLVIPPQIELPTFYENRVKYPITEEPKYKFIELVKNYFIRKFTVKEPKTLKTTFISFDQHSEYLKVNKETSLMRIVSSIKSLPEIEINLNKFKKGKTK